MGELRMIVDFTPEEPTREFSDDWVGSKYGKAYTAIAAHKNKRQALCRAITAARGGEPAEVDDLLDKVFDENHQHMGVQPLPWYLDTFFRAIHGDTSCDSSSCYRITVKACKQFYWYSLSRLDAEGEPIAFVRSPYFRATGLPHPNNSKNMRGLADTLLLLAPELEGMDSSELEAKAASLLKWFTVNLDVIVKKRKDGRLHMVVKPDVSAGKSVNLPAHKRNFLMSSPNVREAVSSLSEVWHGPASRSVLICAWTGSGKEELVNLLRESLIMPLDDCATASAAELGTFKDLREWLSALARQKRIKQRSDAADDEDADSGMVDRVSVRENPLSPFRMLFLDEIHHGSAADLRSGLLRLMEVRQLDDPKEPVNLAGMMYVLAGSAPKAHMRTLDPPDLWTRMEHTVEMKHPLMVSDSAIRRRVLKDYFCMFWRQAVSEWSDALDKSVGRGLQERMTSEAMTDDICERFAREVGSPLVQLVSVRELRVMARRLLTRMIRSIETADGELSQRFEAALDGLPEWIVDIFAEVVPSGDPRAPF